MTAPSKEKAKKMAEQAINKWAIGFASIAWLPGLHYVMAAADISFVIQVGSAYGVELDREKAAKIFTLVVYPLIVSKIAHSALDFFPILGWAVKSALVLRVTKLVGEALIAHFEQISPLPED